MRSSSFSGGGNFRRAFGLALALATFIGLAGCQTDGGDVAMAGEERRPALAQGEFDAQPAAAEQRPGGRRRAGDTTVAFPTGQRATSAIVMDVDAPEQVRAGEPFTYQLKLTNASETPLTNVRVRRIAGTPRDEDGARTAGARQAPAGRQQGANQQGTANRQGGANQQGRAGAQGGESAARPTGRDEWEVGMLMPGETRTVAAEAVAEEVGQFESCLVVTYDPAVCVTTRVVQPALRLTKEGPSQVLICEPITYTYAVTNTGSGVAKNVTVREELPDGLVTEQGHRVITLNAGDIPAGQTKRAQVRIKPQRTGEYTSRALAMSEATKAQSGAVTTVVQEPVLALDVQAPEWEYLGQTVTYRVTVTNKGDGPARETKLVLEAPEWAEEVAPRDVGVLEPGQSRSFAVTMPARRAGDLQVAAAAEAFCAERVVAKAATEIRTIAALLLETVDNNDPVRVGETTTYQVVVKNQGFGPANNVRVTAQLPEGLSFVGAQGETDVKAQGQNLTFTPIKTLAPGAVATWWVEARAEKPGMSQFRLELNADSLENPAIEQEPTRVYQP